MHAFNLAVGKNCGAFANRASATVLNRVTGIVLTVLGAGILAVNYIR